MIVWMLIERGMASRLHSEVAHVKVRRVLVGANQNLASGTISVAIFWSVGAHRHALPAQFAFFHISQVTNSAHKWLSHPKYFAIKLAYAETTGNAYKTMVSAKRQKYQHVL